MKALAIDVGTRRIGIAFGEEGIVSSFTTLNISSPKEQLGKLTDLIAKERPKVLIFGLPLRLDGTEGQEAGTVRNLAHQLASQFNLPAVFIDERLTSKEAEDLLRSEGIKEKKIKEQVDARVAKILMEQYFRDRQSARQS